MDKTSLKAKDAQEAVNFHTYEAGGELDRARSLTACPSYEDMTNALVEHGFDSQDIEWTSYAQVIVPKHIYVMLADNESSSLGPNVLVDSYGNQKPEYAVVNPFPVGSSDTCYKTDLLINELENICRRGNGADLAEARYAIEAGLTGFEDIELSKMSYTDAWGRARQWRAVERALAAFIIELCSLHHYKVFGYWLANVIGQVWSNPTLPAARSRASLMIGLLNYHSYCSKYAGEPSYGWLTKIRARGKLKDFIIFMVQAARLDFFVNLHKYDAPPSYTRRPAAEVAQLFRGTASIFDTVIVEELILNGLDLYKLELGDIVGKTQHMSALCMNLAAMPKMLELCSTLHAVIYEEIRALMDRLNEEKAKQQNLGLFYYKVLEKAPRIIAEKHTIPTVQILSALIDHISELKYKYKNIATIDKDEIRGYQTAATLWLGVRLARALFSKVIRLTIIPGRETPYEALHALSPWVEFCTAIAERALLKFNNVLFMADWEDLPGKSRLRIRTYTFINSYIESLFNEMKYNRGAAPDSSHSFPMPISDYYDRAKKSKRGIQQYNELANAEELLQSNANRILYNVKILEEIYRVLIGRSPDINLSEIFWHIMYLSYRDRIVDITPGCWDKFIILIIWLRMILFMNIKGTSAFGGECLELRILKSIDWRGRQYMSGIGSITDTKLYRFLVTSGFGPVSRDNLLASAGQGLKKYRALKTKAPPHAAKIILADGAITRTQLRNIVVGGSGGAELSDITTVFGTFFKVRALEEHPELSRIDSAIALDLDSTGSGTQLVSRAIGDTKTAERFNVYIRKEDALTVNLPIGGTRDGYLEIFEVWLKSTQFKSVLAPSVAKSFIMKGLYGQLKPIFVKKELCPELLSRANSGLLNIFIFGANNTTEIVNSSEPKFLERQKLLEDGAKRLGGILYDELLAVTKKEMPCYAQYLSFIRLVVLLLGAGHEGWSFELAVKKEISSVTPTVMSNYHKKKKQQISRREKPLSGKAALEFHRSINSLVENYMKRQPSLWSDFEMRVFPEARHWNKVTAKYKEKSDDRKKISATLAYLGTDLDMKKMQRASVANFTHAYDSALLTNTINRLAALGIYISAVHDMFTVHEIHVEIFLQIFKEEFLYATDHMAATILGYCDELDKSLAKMKFKKAITNSIDEKMTVDLALGLVKEVRASIAKHEMEKNNYILGQLVQLK